VNFKTFLVICARVAVRVCILILVCVLRGSCSYT